jgi:hypothetical protein
MSATGTLIDVAAERCRPATLNRQQDFHVLPREPPAAPLDECVSRGADEIGHLQCVNGSQGHLLVTRQYPTDACLLTYAHAKRPPRGRLCSNSDRTSFAP